MNTSLSAALPTNAAGHGMERREAPRPTDGCPSPTTPAETAADPMKDTP
jgi:hypothetical protein